MKSSRARLLIYRAIMGALNWCNQQAVNIGFDYNSVNGSEKRLRKEKWCSNVFPNLISFSSRPRKSSSVADLLMS